MAEELGRALSWDEPIDNTPDDEFVLFDAGDYPFEVTKIERATFNGSAKMAASPMAKLTLKLTNPADGSTSYAFYNIILNAKMMRRIKEFFISVGLAPEKSADGDRFAPRWDAVVGATGWLHMEHREYNGDTYADVKKCLKPSEVAKKGLSATPQQAAYAAPAATAPTPQVAAVAPQQMQQQTYVQQQVPMAAVPAQQPMVAPAGMPVQQTLQQVPPVQAAPAAPAPGVF